MTSATDGAPSRTPSSPASTGAPRAVHADAHWSDRRTGISEEATFLEHDGSRILAFVDRPTAGLPIASMLLCSSLYNDLDLNYRSELLLGRTLAARGIAAARFHYRGTGNSDDVDGGAVTFESMVADARAVGSWLVGHTGAPRLLLCGFRIGALIAAEVARSSEGAPLALWAPMVSGAEYYRGLSRASRVVGARAAARRTPTSAGAESQLSEQASVDMLGNLVHRASYQDLRGRSLPADVGDGRSVLLVQMGLTEVNAQYESLASGWRAAGASLDLLKIRTRQLWMIPDAWEPEEHVPTTTQIVDGIADWAVRATGEQSS